MPLPDKELATLLAQHHVKDLTLTEKRAAIACALQLTDGEVARWLVVAPATVRGQIGRALHRVFDGLDVKPSRALLGRWCRAHWTCCAWNLARRHEEGTLFDPSHDQAERGSELDKSISMIDQVRAARSRIEPCPIPSKPEGSHRIARRRWSVGLLLAATIGVLLGTGLAGAAFDSDSNSSSHNGCDYSGYVSYSTNGPQYSYSQSFSACHAYIVLSYWECPSGCTEEAYSGWIGYPGFPVFDNRTVVTPPNVYGYHQIRKPSTSYSTTIETHAN